MTLLQWDDLRLKVHILLFDIRMTTPVRLPPFKGSALRGAWKGVLTRAYCPATPEERQQPGHADGCPACYLTERENDPEARKPYALRPPLTHETDFPPGATLRWGMVLFGPAWLLLSYIFSTVHDMGHVAGIGHQPGKKGARGRFELTTAYAEHPFRPHHREIIYTKERPLVITPQNGAVTLEDVRRESERRLDAMSEEEPIVRLRFRTPTRIVHQKKLVKAGKFAFAPFFQRLLERLYMLAHDFGDPPLEDARGRLREAMTTVRPLAERVHVVEDRTWWWDYKGYSSRLKRAQPMGGLMGEVVLRAPKAVWEALMVPLVWGEVAHVGKNAVKGQGWYALSGAWGTGSGKARSEERGR